MTFQPTPDPGGPSAVRLLRPLLALGVLVLVAIGVVTAASWLGEEVGGRFAASATSSTVSIPPGQDVEVVIPDGSSASAIANLLASKGVIRSATQFEAAVRTAGVAGSLRAGSYDLITGMEPDEVIQILQRGPVVVVFDVTIPEGLRVTEIVQILSEASGLDAAEFETALLSGQVESSLRNFPEEPTLTDWEGLLFPDTYRFSERATAADMLGRLADTMEQRVASVDWAPLQELGYDLYQGMVIASLIESEVRVAEERALVASVIVNRLEEGMPLQIDATVLYAVGSRDPSDFDREVVSPYNTYGNLGLPPTPIASPGLASLQAAANPAESDYLYYVLSSADGAHTFSETLEEHNRALQQACEEGILSCG